MHSVPASLKATFCPSRYEHFQDEIGLYFSVFKVINIMIWENTGRTKSNRRSDFHAYSSHFTVLCKPSGVKQAGSFT